MGGDFLTQFGLPQMISSRSPSFSLSSPPRAEDKLKLGLLPGTGLAVLCILVLAGRAAAAPEITLQWSAKECLPGDVVTLQARMTNGNVGGFDLKLPNDEAIEWVAHERGPLIYQSGVYSQEDTVVAQPTHPGKIILKGLHAVIRDGDKSSDEILSAPSLVVGSFGEVADDFTPEPLPVQAVKPKTVGAWWLWLGVVIAGLCALLFLRRRKPHEVAVEPGTQPVLEELGEILENEELPEVRMEQFLEQRSAELSVELREALEAAVYGRTMDREALRVVLEREIAR